MKDNLSLKLFVVLSKASASLNQIVEKDMKTYGLIPTEFAVLELLYHKGKQPIQVLGQKILLSSSSISYVVDKLEKKELIIRNQCENDKRVYYAQLTQQGESLLDKIFPKHEKVIEDIFKDIDNQTKEILIEKLKEIGKHASSM